MPASKETFTLLSFSDDSESLTDVPEIVLNPRKKRTKRRQRVSENGSSLAESSRIHHAGCSGVTARAAVLWLAAAVLLLWILALSWLAIVLHGELRRLDSSMRAVSVSSQGVPEALQKCHESSRELQNNQSALSTRVADLQAQLVNFTQQLTTIQTGLEGVQKSLKASPELVNVPQQLLELTNGVSLFGSQIKDISATVTSLKEQNTQLQYATNTLQQNVTSLKKTIVAVSNATSHPTDSTNQEMIVQNEAMLNIIAQIATNISVVNTTLNERLQWAQAERKEHKIKIDRLVEDSANISTQVASVQVACSHDVVRLATLDESISNLTKRLLSRENATAKLTDAVTSLQSQLYVSKSNESVKKPPFVNTNLSLRASELPPEEVLDVNTQEKKTLPAVPSPIPPHVQPPAMDSSILPNTYTPTIPTEPSSPTNVGISGYGPVPP